MRASIVIVSLALIGLAGVAALDAGASLDWAELAAGTVAAAVVGAAVLLHARVAANRRRRRTPHTWPSGGGTLIDHGR
jgi:hypothetical protein